SHSSCATTRPPPIPTLFPYTTLFRSALVPKVITLNAKAHDGKLFGSIHDAEIVAAVAEQTGITIDRKSIVIGEPIRTLGQHQVTDRKSTRLNSSHVKISYAVFCLKKK